MNTPLICYILIGPPGCGKSTIAEQLVKYNPQYEIVSTDQIRQQLYGDAKIQGNWEVIEEKVFFSIEQFITVERPIIYDATNYKRHQRIELLLKLAKYKNVYWVGLYVPTKLSICLKRNQQRSRHVPEDIIKTMYQYLSNFPPIPSEGFTAVYSINHIQDSLDIEKYLPTVKDLNEIIVNRRIFTRRIKLHRYSKLIDFERLMHLIALPLHYPGIGTLHSTNPEFLQEILQIESKFATSIDEISAVMSKLYTYLYADYKEIQNDLAFIYNNGISRASFNEEIIFPDYQENISTIIPHSYSDQKACDRLLKTIRFIVHKHFCSPKNTHLEEQLQKPIDILLKELQSAKVPTTYYTLRKDIKQILKPYKILSNILK